MLFGITNYALQAMEQLKVELGKVKNDPESALEILQAAEKKHQNNSEIYKWIKLQKEQTMDEMILNEIERIKKENDQKRAELKALKK